MVFTRLYEACHKADLSVCLKVSSGNYAHYFFITRDYTIACRNQIKYENLATDWAGNGEREREMSKGTHLSKSNEETTDFPMPHPADIEGTQETSTLKKLLSFPLSCCLSAWNGADATCTWNAAASSQPCKAMGGVPAASPFPIPGKDRREKEETGKKCENCWEKWAKEGHEGSFRKTKPTKPNPSTFSTDTGQVNKAVWTSP